jgi:hypothetical protein
MPIITNVIPIIFLLVGFYFLKYNSDIKVNTVPKEFAKRLVYC